MPAWGTGTILYRNRPDAPTWGRAHHEVTTVYDPFSKNRQWVRGDDAEFVEVGQRVGV